MESVQAVDPTRIRVSDGVTPRELDALVAKTDLRVVQTSSPLDASTWSMLNATFFARRPDVQLRVYGFYSMECDLSFVSGMTNVRHFAADGLMRARHVERIADLSQLESLSIGIFELENFDVLRHVSPGLTKLVLGATRSKKPDLAPLARFRGLRELYIEGHTKNIEVIADLTGLEDLTLRSVTTRDLSYVAPLPNLWSLDIKLGGIRSLGALEGLPNLKYLELWQIRGLTNIQVISRLPGLQDLFLQSLPHIHAFPDLRAAKSLRRVVVQNLKGLLDFTALEWAPALEEFALIDGQKQEPEQLLPVLRNPAVKRVAAGFGSDRKNNRFAELRRQHGKQEF